METVFILGGRSLNTKETTVDQYRALRDSMFYFTPVRLQIITSFWSIYCNCLLLIRYDVNHLLTSPSN